MQRRSSSLVLALLALLPHHEREAQAPGDDAHAVLPKPSVLTAATGGFTLSARTPLIADATLAEVARTFSRDIAGARGFQLAVSGGASRSGAIQLRRVTGKAAATLGMKAISWMCRRAA